MKIKEQKLLSTCVTMEVMMTPKEKTKKILIATGLFVLLFATTAWATTPRVSWEPEQLIPNSIAPGASMEYVVTLKNSGFVPIPTQQLQVIATGNAASFLTITQPNWPPVLKRGNGISVRLLVSVSEDTPLSVERGEIFVRRVLPNGKIKETFSAILSVELTFSSIPIPPDPGEAGKADLLGIDFDQDGVRDDINRYIAFTQPDSEKKREALKQSARALSDYLRDNEDKAKTRENGKANEKAIDCLAHVFNGDLDVSDKAGEELDARFLNTSLRSIAYKKADSKMGGYVSNNGPSSERFARRRAACEFDADSLPN